MCVMWLQVVTLAHDFTSSQEVTCRYALRATASLVVPLFHSPTLRDHVCESCMLMSVFDIGRDTACMTGE